MYQTKSLSSLIELITFGVTLFDDKERQVQYSWDIDFIVPIFLDLNRLSSILIADNGNLYHKAVMIPKQFVKEQILVEYAGNKDLLLNEIQNNVYVKFDYTYDKNISTENIYKSDIYIIPQNKMSKFIYFNRGYLYGKYTVTDDMLLIVYENNIFINFIRNNVIVELYTTFEEVGILNQLRTYLFPKLVEIESRKVLQKQESIYNNWTAIQNDLDRYEMYKFDLDNYLSKLKFCYCIEQMDFVELYNRNILNREVTFIVKQLVQQVLSDGSFSPMWFKELLKNQYPQVASYYGIN